MHWWLEWPVGNHLQNTLEKALILSPRSQLYRPPVLQHAPQIEVYIFLTQRPHDVTRIVPNHHTKPSQLTIIKKGRIEVNLPTLCWWWPLDMGSSVHRIQRLLVDLKELHNQLLCSTTYLLQGPGVRDRTPGPFYDKDVGPNPCEWVESCYCLSKWRFDWLYFPP